MIEIKSYVCEGPGCTSIKRDTNHWYVIDESHPGVLSVITFEMAKSPSLATIMDLAETLGVHGSEILRRVEERLPKPAPNKKPSR
jgi:hypothetical protein